MFLTVMVTLTMAVADSAPQTPSSAAGPLVTVEFRAVTEAGSPVTDLKAGDITLKIDGRERVIRAFELMPIGDKAAAPTPVVMPAPFATNALSTSGPRDTLLLIDDESIAPGDEKRLITAVDQYVNGLGTSDRLGVVTVKDRGLNVSITNDHASIRKAVAAMVGRGRSTETADDSACRTRRVLGALISVAGNFPPSGPPVTVLVFSTGLTPPGTATMSRIGRSSSSSAPSEVCEVQPRDYQQLQAAALGSSLNIYVVASSLAPSPTLQSGLEQLAGYSGNALVQLVKGGDSDMVRVVRENSAWYRVAFEPEATERNGSIQRVELQVKRSGVEARVRPQVLIPKPDPTATGGQASSAKDMLREARVYRDFQFRAAAFSSQEPGSDKVKLVVLFEPVDPSAAVKSAVVGLYDAKGKLAVQGTGEAANLARTPSTMAVLASPGAYRMRVATVDAAGHRGTVDTDVNVALTRADPLLLGSLILGVAESGSFAGRLTFAAEPVAVGYVEVYGVPKGGRVTARVDIAASDAGPALAEGTTKVLGDGADGRLVILGGIPISQFPSGDLLVRVVVSIDGNPAGRVVRTLRKR